MTVNTSRHKPLQAQRRAFACAVIASAAALLSVQPANAATRTTAKAKATVKAKATKTTAAKPKPTTPPRPQAAPPSAAPTSAAPTSALSPAAPPAAEPTGQGAPPPSIGATGARSGRFVALDYQGKGKVTLTQGPSGADVAFTEFSVDAGPDLRVHLSPVAADADPKTLLEGATELGRLRARTGDQQYAVPNRVVLASQRSVVIWCHRVNAPFVVASLDP